MLVNWSSNLTDVTVLTNPAAADIVASQLNDQRPAGVPEAVDLSQAILDIVLESSVQGASILEVHIADQYWQLATSGFIATDDTGLLIPVEVNYPQDSDCFWWLASCEYSVDMTQANLTLTFEDRIVSQMRDVSGAQGGRKHAFQGESLAQFIGDLVAAADPNIRYRAPSLQEFLQALAAEGVSNPAKYWAVEPMQTGTRNPKVHPPPSSKGKGASHQRRNYLKKPGDSTPPALTAQQQHQRFTAAKLRQLELLTPPPDNRLQGLGYLGYPVH